MDPDPGGPKTCGSGGSGFGSGTLLLRLIPFQQVLVKNFVWKKFCCTFWPWGWWEAPWGGTRSRSWWWRECSTWSPPAGTASHRPKQRSHFFIFCFIYCLQFRMYLKGPVSRDFLLQVFFVDHLAYLYRLHTAFLHWPLSSAATKEVQGPDTTWRRIQGHGMGKRRMRRPLWAFQLLFRRPDSWASDWRRMTSALPYSATLERGRTDCWDDLQAK